MFKTRSSFQPPMGEALIRFVLELQHVITYFRFGSGTKLRIILDELQERLCIDECNMDCDFNINIDMFSGDFISLQFCMHEFTISRISFGVDSLIQRIDWFLPQLVQSKTQIWHKSNILITFGLHLTIYVSPYTLIVFW